MRSIISTISSRLKTVDLNDTVKQGLESGSPWSPGRVRPPLQSHPAERARDNRWPPRPVRPTLNSRVMGTVFRRSRADESVPRWPSTAFSSGSVFFDSTTWAERPGTRRNRDRRRVELGYSARHRPTTSHPTNMMMIDATRQMTGRRMESRKASWRDRFAGAERVDRVSGPGSCAAPFDIARATREAGLLHRLRCGPCNKKKRKKK